MMTRIEGIASWVHAFVARDVPSDVLELVRAQRRSVLGAIAASVGTGAADRVLRGVSSWAQDGPAPLLGTGRPASVAAALYAGAALSVALDYDDYVCFGHTGHSAVLTPVFLAAETEADSETQIAAQVAANEVAARLGGACLIGPLNGQMWAHVHAAGAAVAAAKVMGLDVARSAHALALALAQPGRPTVPGFMAPDSKLVTAAEPAAAGLRAARLAAAGVTGPLDVLDHERGFLRAFSYAPLAGLLSGLGESWATRTLCIKIYPGCAYVDTAVDALMELGPPPPDDIERVEVRAGLLTCGMNEMSARYARGAVPAPVTINFSIPWTVAVTLVAGRLTRDELTDDWLSAHAPELEAAARRVRLRHDPMLTRRAAPGFLRLLPPKVVRREIGARRFARGVARMRAEHPRVRLSPRDLMILAGAARPKERLPQRFWDERALEDFTMALPAHVEVTLKDGRVVSAEATVPLGAAGNRDLSPAEAGRRKLHDHGPRLWGEAGREKIDAAIEGDSPDLHTLLFARAEG